MDQGNPEIRRPRRVPVLTLLGFSDAFAPASESVVHVPFPTEGNPSSFEVRRWPSPEEFLEAIESQMRQIEAVAVSPGLLLEARVLWLSMNFLRSRTEELASRPRIVVTPAELDDEGAENLVQLFRLLERLKAKRKDGGR